MNFEQWLYTLPLRLRDRCSAASRWIRNSKTSFATILSSKLQENVEKGMSPEDARYAAMRAMGGITQIEQQCRDARGHNFIEDSFRICATDFGNFAGIRDFLLSQFCASPWPSARTLRYSVGSKEFYSVPTRQSLTRSGCVALAGTAPGESGATEISWPDFEDLQRNCTLCDEFFVSKITGTHSQYRRPRRKSRPAALSRQTISTRSVCAPFLGAASNRRRCRKQRPSRRGYQL